MQHEGLLKLALTDAALHDVVQGVGVGHPQYLWGLSDPVKALVTAVLAESASVKGNILLITPDSSSAERARQALSVYLGDERVQPFPVLEVLPYEVIAQISAAGPQRVRALYSLRTPRKVVVAAATALTRKLIPPQVFSEHCFAVTAGQSIDLTALSRRLVQAGYRRVDLVQLGGEFSLRGGIVDIFSPAHPHPVRLELFGDEVDNIRFFAVDDQRSLDVVDLAEIIPAREFIADEPNIERARVEIEAAYQKMKRQRSGDEGAGRLQELIVEVLDRLEQQVLWDGVVTYAPYFYPALSQIFDYLLDDSLVIFDEADRIGQTLQQWETELHNIYTSRLEKGMLLPGQFGVYGTANDILESGQRFAQVKLSLLAKESRPGPAVREFPSRPVVAFSGHWSRLLEEVRRWQAEHRIVVFALSEGERSRKLTEQLREESLNCSRQGALSEIPSPSTVTVINLPLPTGFELPSLGLVVVSDSELYGQSRAGPNRAKGAQRRRSADWLEFRIGDYVVHDVHGIGKYLGVRTLEIEGVNRDYLFVQYAGSDALYVPTDQVALIEKYVGREGNEPRVSKLGGSEWAKVKKKVRQSVREMAQQLLTLYAVREKVKGHSFSPDTVWQQEFEEAFAHEDTPDQVKAIAEIKHDMERSRPMDRLLCGDVGYGKTEVAVRAAFKAVVDGKQVGVLVPTTILAQQHYHTFTERFRGYPVHVEVLSRFRSPSEQERIVKEVQAGSVDIVIGTHRLLSKDIRFADLGLLVVDEEQRFGVAHKERLKQLRQAVDVLTLTATPIPRTLHMAMTGLRDISIIDTPPENRYPVQTYVLPHDEDLVRDVMARELTRQGQAFYVHNRVRSMQRAAQRLEQLLPLARVASAHGQMREERLERLMLEFLEGQYDVLACTTIIESGLDMPNVNTLVVEDADKLGLAQLYQLRGRVGRSDRLAYAYFMYRKDRALSEVAEKRLHAISEFTELGSGFKLAMRDLEIRGAGNILGPEQHGFIVAVGFDLYCQLLEEALRELQGLPLTEVAPTVSVELGVHAYLPDIYVPDSRQKLDLYKKLAATDSLEAVHEVTEELIDRYGEMPTAAENLVTVARIRAYALQLGLVSISQAHGRLWLKPRLGQTLPVSALKEAQPQYRHRVTGGTVRSPALALRADDWAKDKLLPGLETFLRHLVALQQKKGEMS